VDGILYDDFNAVLLRVGTFLIAVFVFVTMAKLDCTSLLETKSSISHIKFAVLFIIFSSIPLIIIDVILSDQPILNTLMFIFIPFQINGTLHTSIGIMQVKVDKVKEDIKAHKITNVQIHEVKEKYEEVTKEIKKFNDAFRVRIALIFATALVLCFATVIRVLENDNLLQEILYIIRFAIFITHFGWVLKASTKIMKKNAYF